MSRPYHSLLKYLYNFYTPHTYIFGQPCLEEAVDRDQPLFLLYSFSLVLTNSHIKIKKAAVCFLCFLVSLPIFSFFPFHVYLSCFRFLYSPCSVPPCLRPQSFHVLGCCSLHHYNFGETRRRGQGV